MFTSPSKLHKYSLKCFKIRFHDPFSAVNVIYLKGNEFTASFVNVCNSSASGKSNKFNYYA